MIIELAEKDEMPDNVPPVVRRAVKRLKKTRHLALGSRGRARPYKKRQALLERIALEESQKLGVPISGQQLRHWSGKREYEKLREKLFPRKT